MYKNIIANFIGRFLSIFSNYLFIPVYISLLGMESYSIISFSLVILGITSFLDAGLTATLSREFASKEHDPQKKVRIFSTLESCYLLVVVFIIVIFVFFSGYIATNWLKLNQLDPQKAAFYLKIIGTGVALQLLCNFYVGGLMGLERQVKANKYQIAWGIMRNGVVVLILYFYPTLTAFFCWQIFTTVVYVLVLRFSIVRLLLGNSRFYFKFNFDKDIIRIIGGFASGMFFISLVQSINTQLDKIIISKSFNVKELGYYTIANSLAQGLLIMVGPISVALLPRLTALFSENRSAEAVKLFHKAYLIISILVFSVAANLMFNGHNIIWAWTGNMKIADVSYKYVPFLAAGSAILATLVFPFNIAIANKYTRLNNILGIATLMFTIPMYWFMVKRFGPIGAAFSWFLLQLIITPVYIHYINKLFLKVKSTFQILFKEFFLPAIISLLVAFLFSIIKTPVTSRLFIVLWIGIATISTMAINIFILVPLAQIKGVYNLVSIKSKVSK